MLPDPSLVLTNPSSKSLFKNTAKSRVFDYWETKLRAKAASLDSLCFFKSDFYSLRKPHPIWRTAGANPHEVQKACSQAKMISGRYRTCQLTRHWSGDSSGECSLPSCRLSPVVGSLPHILIDCPDLQPARERVFSLWADYLEDKPDLIPIVRKYSTETGRHPIIPLLPCGRPQYIQFLLDCSVLPDVICARQLHGQGVLDSLFYLTRTLCFAVHKARFKLLGKWNIQ